jgi:hypothetical protein
METTSEFRSEHFLIAIQEHYHYANVFGWQTGRQRAVKFSVVKHLVNGRHTHTRVRVA